jgi:hypothetical protein
MQEVHMTLVQLLISISTELNSFYNGVCPIKIIISKIDASSYQSTLT